MYTSRFLLIFFIVLSPNLYSQTKSTLEKQKKEIIREIKQIESKLANTKKEKGLIISDVEDINYKIILQENLINNINNQLNIIINDIDLKEKKLFDLNERESLLKEELSKMILKSYKKKSNLNKIMFIFSSSSFAQAYKRIQYFKQYANFQNKTISKIINTSSEITNVIIKLDSHKFNKETLIVENELIKKNLSKEFKNLNNLISQANKNQKKYASEIKKKQKLSKEIDKHQEKSNPQKIYFYHLKNQL